MLFSHSLAHICMIYATHSKEKSSYCSSKFQPMKHRALFGYMFLLFCCGHIFLKLDKLKIRTLKINQLKWQIIVYIFSLLLVILCQHCSNQSCNGWQLQEKLTQYLQKAVFFSKIWKCFFKDNSVLIRDFITTKLEYWHNTPLTSQIGATWEQQKPESSTADRTQEAGRQRVNGTPLDWNSEQEYLCQVQAGDVTVLMNRMEHFFMQFFPHLCKVFTVNNSVFRKLVFKYWENVKHAAFECLMMDCWKIFISNGAVKWCKLKDRMRHNVSVKNSV